MADLFGAPQGEPHRAVHIEVERLEDAQRLHHDGAAGGVVAGPGAGVPRVEVAADHDDLVALRPAGDLGDDVLSIDVAVERLVRRDECRAAGRPTVWFEVADVQVITRANGACGVGGTLRPTPRVALDGCDDMITLGLDKPLFVR